jgi:hypothetical protein
MNTTNEISSLEEGVEPGVMTGAMIEEAIAESEGPIERSMERRTSRLPSDLFLWAAGTAVLVSLGFEIAGMRRTVGRGIVRRGIVRRLLSRDVMRTSPLSVFVGMWVPSLLLLGVYSKIVKITDEGRVPSL